MDDLANKLRQMASDMKDDGLRFASAIITKAADALDAKDKRIAELEARLKYSGPFDPQFFIDAAKAKEPTQ
jgi:hypothetical protein